MTHWTPQTRDAPFLFDRRHPKLAGIRATHSPSPWMGDFGHFNAAASLGPPLPTPTARAQAAHRFQAAPHRFAAELPRDGIRLAVTATACCGVIRIDFPADAGEGCVVIQTGRGTTDAVSSARVDADGRTLRGTSRANHGGVAENFGCRWVATVEGAEVLSSGTLTPEGVAPGTRAVEHARAGVFLRLRPNGPVTLRIGTSFVDGEHARAHLRREVEGAGFDEVAAASVLGCLARPAALPLGGPDHPARLRFGAVARGPVPDADARARHRRRDRSPQPVRRPRSPRRRVHEQRLLGHPPHRVPAAHAHRPRGLRRDRGGLPRRVPAERLAAQVGEFRATATAWSARTPTA